jgi:methionyl-tRNA synthetase
VYTAICAIDMLKTMLAPFIPFTCEKLHTYLGYDAPLFGSQFVANVKDDLGEHNALRYNHDGASGEWRTNELQPGRLLRQPGPLFKKLEPEIIEQERDRLGKK